MEHFNRRQRENGTPTAFRPLFLFAVVTALPILFTACQVDTTPPGPVTGLTATPGYGQVALALTNPSDADLDGVRVQLKHRRISGLPDRRHHRL